MKKVISEVAAKIRREISLNVDDNDNATEVMDRVHMFIANTFGSELIDYEIKKITIEDKE